MALTDPSQREALTLTIALDAGFASLGPFYPPTPLRNGSG